LMDFNYVFFSGHFTCGCTLYKKMRHFCDIGLHNCNFLLDYNDLTLYDSLIVSWYGPRIYNKFCCCYLYFLEVKYVTKWYKSGNKKNLIMRISVLCD